MQSLLTRLLLSWSATLCVLSSAQAQDSKKSHAFEVIHSQFIFPTQKKHVHSSSIVECPNGDLLAVWFHGSGERTADDVVIQGSRLVRGKEDWGGIFLAADTPGLPDCNPVVFLDGSSRLRLVWIVVQANRWEQSLLKIRTSSDYQGDGPPEWDWQDVILLRPGNTFSDQLREGFRILGYRQRMWAEYALPYERMLVEAASDPVKRDIGWMPRAKPLTLSTGPQPGRILLPLYSDGFNVSLMAISDDDGDHWRPSAPIVGLGCVQPTLAQRRDGTVVAFLRDAGVAPGRVQVSESLDAGETWTVARDTDLPNPGSSVAVCVLTDGRWLLALNDTESGRHRIAIIVSEDEGKNWNAPMYLDESAPDRGRYGYPSMIQARDGRVHLTYTHEESGRKSIRHVILAGLR